MFLILSKTEMFMKKIFKLLLFVILLPSMSFFILSCSKDDANKKKIIGGGIENEVYDYVYEGKWEHGNILYYMKGDTFGLYIVLQERWQEWGTISVDHTESTIVFKRVWVSIVDGEDSRYERIPDWVPPTNPITYYYSSEDNTLTLGTQPYKRVSYNLPPFPSVE